MNAAPKFTEGNLTRHIAVMSFSSSLGIMAIYLVDLFDIFFISLLGQTELAAAAGYASTVLFMVSAVNIGLSNAAGSLIAQALGAGRDRDAREIATCVIGVAVLVSLIVPALLLYNVQAILSLLRAEGEVADLAASYLWIVMPTTVFSGVSMTAVAALRAHGAARQVMFPALLGALVNLILDPLLIFGMGLNLDGAAIATVLARAATMGLALILVFRGFNAFSTSVTVKTLRHLPSVAHYTMPATLASVATPVGTALLTRFMSKYGSDAVAGAAIIGRLFPVVFCFVTGLSSAIGPIVGQNYGAGHITRARSAYIKSLHLIAVYVLVASAGLVLLRTPIANAFGAQGLALDVIFAFCGPLASVALFNGIVFTSNAAFSNLGHPAYSLWITWAKSTVGMLTLATVGSHYWGALGVAYGAVAGAGVFAAISVFFVLRVLGTPGPEVKLKPFDYEAERQHMLLEKGEAVHS